MSNRIEAITLVAGTTLTIGLLFFFYFFILNKLKKKQLVYFNSINELKTTHENKILITQLEIQESTFKNISQNIHDNISLNLTLAKLNLNTYLMSNSHLNFELLQSSVDLIGRSLIELNDISRSLDSEIINQIGLQRSLEMEMDKLNQSAGCHFELDISGNIKELEPGAALIFFRIIQECCNNILKHSGATQADIKLVHHVDDKTELTIEDNGKGFDIQEMKKRQLSNPRAGLQNIRNRVQLLNGQKELFSEPGKGTKLHIIIPDSIR